MSGQDESLKSFKVSVYLVFSLLLFFFFCNEAMHHSKANMKLMKLHFLWLERVRIACRLMIIIIIRVAVIHARNGRSTVYCHPSSSGIA